MSQIDLRRLGGSAAAHDDCSVDSIGRRHSVLASL
jgi:hypothetical protein